MRSRQELVKKLPPAAGSGASGCRVRPAVNQLLLHIAGTGLPLLDYCTQQDIRVEAYSPIAHGEALKNPAITAMAESASTENVSGALQVDAKDIPGEGNYQGTVTFQFTLK